jgi:hypothetical protein
VIIAGEVIREPRFEHPPCVALDSGTIGANKRSRVQLKKRARLLPLPKDFHLRVDVLVALGMRDDGRHAIRLQMDESLDAVKRNREPGKLNENEPASSEANSRIGS